MTTDQDSVIRSQTYALDPAQKLDLLIRAANTVAVMAQDLGFEGPSVQLAPMGGRLRPDMRASASEVKAYEHGGNRVEILHLAPRVCIYLATPIDPSVRIARAEAELHAARLAAGTAALGVSAAHTTTGYVSRVDVDYDIPMGGGGGGGPGGLIVYTAPLEAEDVPPVDLEGLLIESMERQRAAGVAEERGEDGWSGEITMAKSRRGLGGERPGGGL